MPNEATIAKIEKLLEDQVDGLLDSSRTMTIPVRNTQASFPGVRAQEAWQYTVYLRILTIIHDALIRDVIISKRDIYYRDPALFGKQSVVDRVVDDLATTFSTPRAGLNVVAAAKGLVAGALRIQHAGGTITDYSNDQEGQLITTLTEADTLDISRIAFVLVIEKEATFRSIAYSTLWPRLSTSAVILTAKGYPDIASRDLVVSLSKGPYPIYALMDCDPDGINILDVYLRSVPLITSLGLSTGHMLQSEFQKSQGLLCLTNRDRRKVTIMLSRVGENDRCRRTELQVMLMLNLKAELQILQELEGGMASWLGTQLGYST